MFMKLDIIAETEVPEESSNQSSQTLGAASYCLIAYRLCLCHNLQTLPKAQRTQANQSDIFNSSASGTSSMSSGGEKKSQVTGIERQWSDMCLIKSWQFLAIFLQLQVFSYWLSLVSFIHLSSFVSTTAFSLLIILIKCSESSKCLEPRCSVLRTLIHNCLEVVQNHSFYILRLSIIKLD